MTTAKEVLANERPWAILEGDALSVLASMPGGSVQCAITSPPYFGLRNYKSGNAELGREQRHDCCGWSTGCRCGECYVDRLTAVFAELRRVLRDDGIFLLNIGDSMADKNLLGIPWRVALSLQADGWILRNHLPWIKANPMPSSAFDRLVVAHEDLFVFAKQPRYFWDDYAVRKPSAVSTLTRDHYTRITAGKDGEYSVAHDHETPSDPAGRKWRTDDVWLASLDVAIAEAEDRAAHLREIRNGRGLLLSDDGEPLAVRPSAESYHGEHKAVFPVSLVTPFLRVATSSKGCCSQCGAAWRRVVEKRGKRLYRDSSSSKKQCAIYTEARAGRNGAASSLFATGEVANLAPSGWQPGCNCVAAESWPCVVLDPFAGSGTSLVAAQRLGLRALGIELSPKWANEARQRVASVGEAVQVAREKQAELF